MLVMYDSAHDAITFQLLEMSSITAPNLAILNNRTKVHFSKLFFFWKNIGNFTYLHNEKKNLEVLCKPNCFGYRNSCKRLLNFVNMAALLVCILFHRYQVCKYSFTFRIFLEYGLCM